MVKRWLPIFIAASFIAAPLGAGAAPGQDHAHDHGPGHSHGPAPKAVKKPAKPGAKAAKPTAKFRAGAARRSAVTTPAKRPFWEIPQASSLAETPDVVLNSRVRAALISNLGNAGREIIPETAKGVVTLTGTVSTPQQRARAELVARKMRGVRAVKNRLTVKKTVARR
jgi:hypothetical protein